MKYTIRIAQIIIIGLIIIYSNAFAADEIGVRACIDRNSITIGDRIKLTIDVTAPRSSQIQMPAFKDGLIGEFEIKDSSIKKQDHLFGGRTYRYLYYITIYSTGKKEIQGIDVKYKLKGSKDWGLKKTKSISVEVRSVLPKVMPADVKDIKGPLAFFELNWILIILILALVAVLISALIIYLRMRNRKPVKLPHETALEELEALRAGLINKGDVKEYFVGVSDCIRGYVERSFKLRAPEMTSEEFFNSLHNSSVLSVSHRELLKGFVNACDMVKFAKYSPKRDEIDNVYTTAKNFVYETKEVK